MRIYIISPYPTVRAGLTALAHEQPGWVVAGASSPAALAAALGGASGGASGAAASAEPAEGLDIALLDLEAGFVAESVADWLELLRPRSGVVALGAAEAPGDGRGAREQALRQTLELARLVTADGLGFGALPRDAGTEEIIAALTAAANGLTTLDRSLALEALSGLERRRPEPVSEQAEPLTAREREVLQLLAQGIPNKQIAQRLSISEHTVKFHVSAIMTKLGAASRTEAVTTAARRGLLLL
ncbi:MAG TPA: response regulator transcription factor [Ktedonobacterales bacterium]|jgi:DNA-binding CsgD family transcriptional regulator|nr:response regulator transcription factor [Ktedonobacterales bacterium]